MFSSSLNTSINSNKLEIGLKYDTLLGYLIVEVNRGLNLFDQFTTDKAPSKIFFSLLNLTFSIVNICYLKKVRTLN